MLAPHRAPIAINGALIALVRQRARALARKIGKLSGEFGHFVEKSPLFSAARLLWRKSLASCVRNR